MDTKKIKPGLGGILAHDKLMEINQGSLIKAIINYVGWSCIDWKTVWVTAMLTSGAASDESWRVGLLKPPLCHLSYPVSSLWSAETLRVRCHDAAAMIQKTTSRLTHSLTELEFRPDILNPDLWAKVAVWARPRPMHTITTRHRPVFNPNPEPEQRRILSPMCILETMSEFLSDISSRVLSVSDRDVKFHSLTAQCSGK